MESQATQARQNSRAPVVMNAKLRIIGGKGVDVSVIDLTADGCRIAKPSIELRVKQQVAVKLESLDYLKGCVRWSDESTAGIEFERPLYGPVFEHLQRIYPR